MTKDMSRAQFLAALKRHGMSVELGFMGYVRLNIPGHHMQVSYLNAPSRTWRGALAYLLATQERELAKLEKTA